MGLFGSSNTAKDFSSAVNLPGGFGFGSAASYSADDSLPVSLSIPDHHISPLARIPICSDLRQVSSNKRAEKKNRMQALDYRLCCRRYTSNSGDLKPPGTLF